MKHIATLGLACLALGCAPAEPVEMSAGTQGRLDEALAGRVAGPPVDCVNSSELRSNRTFGDGAILFEARGDVLYLNQPPGGCGGLGPGRAFRTTTTVSRMCRGDIITVFEPVSGAEYGGCGLGEFVPYRRAP
jgi:hypothetical protein